MTLCFMIQTAPSFIHLGYKETSTMHVVSTGNSVQGTALQMEAICSTEKPVTAYQSHGTM